MQAEFFISFFEIYGGKVFDLLNSREKLNLLEDAKGQVCIQGLQEVPVDSVEETEFQMGQAHEARMT